MREIWRGRERERVIEGERKGERGRCREKEGGSGGRRGGEREE